MSEKDTEEVEIPIKVNVFPGKTLFLREHIGEAIMTEGPDKGKKVEVALNMGGGQLLLLFGLDDKTYSIMPSQFLDAVLRHRKAERAKKA